MIVVLLPVYNEALSLPALLPKLREWLEHSGQPYRIVIGDDGSTDATAALTAEFAKTMPIEVIRHKRNRGLGETSRDLFEHAAETTAPRDVIVRMDCDNTHEPEFIGHMLAKLDQGYDVAIASRFQPGGGQRGVSAYRATISWCASVFMKVFFPIKGVREYSCGFRAYRAEVIKDAVEYYGSNFIQLTGLGFTCTLEKLVKLKMLGARFGEVPFVLRYDQKESESKMVSSVTTLGYLTMAVLYHWPWGGWRRRHRSARVARPAGGTR